MAKAKDAAGNPVTSVRASLTERAKATRRPKSRSIRVRATDRGQYGRPIPDIIDAGTVFDFFLEDLEPANTHPRRKTVTVDGVGYELPSWVVEANAPVQADDVDEDEDEELDEPGAPGDSVI